MIYGENSIDHVQSPKRVIEEFSKLLKREGIVVVKSLIKEGAREKWSGYHKWDYWPTEDVVFYISHLGRKHILMDKAIFKHVVTIVSKLYDMPAFTSVFQKSI